MSKFCLYFRIEANSPSARNFIEEHAPAPAPAPATNIGSATWLKTCGLGSAAVAFVSELREVHGFSSVQSSTRVFYREVVNKGRLAALLQSQRCKMPWPSLGWHRQGIAHLYAAGMWHAGVRLVCQVFAARGDGCKWEWEWAEWAEWVDASEAHALQRCQIERVRCLT